MGAITVTLSVLAAFVMLGHVQAAGECPEAAKVYSCSPKCVQNYECTNGKVCCPNQCHLKSCVEPSRYNTGGSSGTKQQSGSGIYCNNVKCNAFEVCKVDKTTSRMKCQRA